MKRKWAGDARKKAYSLECSRKGWWRNSKKLNKSGKRATVGKDHSHNAKPKKQWNQNGKVPDGSMRQWGFLFVISCIE